MVVLHSTCGVVGSLVSQSVVHGPQQLCHLRPVRNAGTQTPPQTYLTRICILQGPHTLKHWCKALELGQDKLDSAMWFGDKQDLCNHESTMTLRNFF